MQPLDRRHNFLILVPTEEYSYLKPFPDGSVAEWLACWTRAQRGPGFKSQPRRCRVTVLGKLFTTIVPLFTKQQNWYSSPLKGCGGNCRPGGK